MKVRASAGRHGVPPREAEGARCVIEEHGTERTGRPGKCKAMQARTGWVRQGWAGHGRHDVECQGSERPGLAWHGGVLQAWFGWAWRGWAGRGASCPGDAGKT